jgi:hypothetical protein
MKVRIAFSALTPVLLLVLAGFFSDHFGDGFIGNASHGLAAFLLTWPLDLLAGLGVISSGDEGLYGRWLTASAIVSLATLGILLFLASALVARRRGA